MKNKNIIAVTNNNQTYDFLFDIINTYEHWNLKRIEKTDDLSQNIVQDDEDLFIIDSEFVTPQIQNIFLSPANKKPYIVILRQSGEIEALSWIHKGACGFLHEPIDEISEETATFVIKSIFRCVKVVSERLNQIAFEKQHDNWFYFSTYSDISALEQFQRFFSMLYSSNLREEDNRNLYLAVNEVCINAIEWGNKKNIDKKIQIYYKFTQDKVILRVLDEGQGFDPSIVPNPMELGPLEIVKIRKEGGKRLGGYGLALVGKIMDKVEFRGKGNEIYMEKRLQYTTKKRSIK